VRNRADVRTDHAFAANYALWDTYYFSGLNLQANSYSHLDATPRDWPSAGADLPLDATVRTQQAAALTAAGVANATTFASLKTALNEGRRPLANKRVTYLADGKPSFTLNPQYQTTLRLPETEFPHPKYLARTSLYDGGFNVNSTSRAAWRAVLGGLEGQTLPDAASPAAPTMTALTKFARAFGPADNTGNDPWTQYRELSEAQIDELAGRVVEEVPHPRSVHVPGRLHQPPPRRQRHLRPQGRPAGGDRQELDQQHRHQLGGPDDLGRHLRRPRLDDPDGPERDLLEQLDHRRLVKEISAYRRSRPTSASPRSAR
jgi:hypothetical protein